MENYRSESWFGIALGALTLGGLLSFVLVLGRVPFLSHLITDVLFAKRSLVIHVNLAIFVWLFAYLAALYSQLSAQDSPAGSRNIIPFIGGSGVIIFSLSGLTPGVNPILSNYFPVLLSPWFFTGMMIFAVALASTFFHKQSILWFKTSLTIRHPLIPQSAQIALRAAAFVYLLALIVFIESGFLLDKDLESSVFYELLFWGCGHVLQAANVLGMLAAWQILLNRALGYSPLKPKMAVILCGVMVAPLLAAPVLTLYINEWGVYLNYFTQLMRWGIFPSVSIVLIISLSSLIREWKQQSISLLNPAVMGFITSATLIVTGFILGAFIRVSSTLIPAHYHASIGAVTVSYMASVYLLIPTFGVEFSAAKDRIFRTLQPIMFGFGQVVFALGFALAGLTRKVYGVEQVIKTKIEYTGLVLMGTGGLLAIIGGVLFVWLTGKTWFVARPVNSFKRGGYFGKQQTSNSEING